MECAGCFNLIVERLGNSAGFGIDELGPRAQGLTLVVDGSLLTTAPECISPVTYSLAIQFVNHLVHPIMRFKQPTADNVLK